MTDYHEPPQELSEETRNFTRALHSLMEEIEAVDWYHQRVDLTKDESLKSIMAHNRDEEIEHACMALEWLRRNMPGWDAMLREFLFTEGNITAHVEESSSEKPDLGIGKINK
ncbi:MAG: ferritin-like domain-containing protein [Bacteroidales bacterium]|nr:ferritin-like domain-containing protein [Bacteroidales bacterium]